MCDKNTDDAKEVKPERYLGILGLSPEDQETLRKEVEQCFKDVENGKV